MNMSQAEIERLNAYADLLRIANTGTQSVAGAWVTIGALMERWAETSCPEGAAEIAKELALVAEFLGTLAGVWTDLAELRKEIDLPPSLTGAALN